MRLGQTSVIYLVAKVLGSAIGFVATIYFTRTLGEEIYGFYAITLALVSWLGIVKSVGFGKAIVKRMSEDEEPDAYLVAGTTVKAVLTMIVAVGVLLFHEQVNAYVGQPVAEFVVLLLIVSIFSGLVNSALKGTHRVHVYAPLSTAKQAVRSGVMVVFVYLGWELAGMLLGYAIGTAVIATIGLLVVRPTFTRPRWRHVISLFDFAKFSWLGSMRKKSFNDVDIIVLGLFVPAGLTGVYAIAYSLAEFLNIFGDAIRTTLFPELSKRSAADDTDMVRTLTNDALSYAGLFLIPGIAGAAILGDRLMLIYGDGFEIGAQVLTILLVGILAYSYNKQLLNTLNAIDRPDLAFRANAAFIVSNLTLNVALVYTIGWVGAAIATASSAAIGLVFGFYYTRRHVGFSIPFEEISKQCFAALLMGVVVYAARAIGEPHPIAAYNEVFVVALVGFGALVYFFVLFAISSTFRTTVSRNLPFDVPLI
ncbi:oligosaccharide flippase family protein [Natrarchaeobaculum sulfurireducens]|uniref:Transport protein 57 (Probable polysaccharide biosynthesis transport protein) n=1 Tax=Natrarchaeobaculum sulfurireducens TaxID=2044521 RepID=A0A346PTK1_9EURY|nr:polysaccharide biosynthesis C-terminal domain-containing protein [Natrarchaeobaculum sulfurireducens]AXR82846.1 transport protein 57 (probable polysaccharide biosynthesis transport protein) [Natrarchaeobaculum sulfurireducens]